MKTHVPPFSSAALALLFAAAVPMLSSCSKSDADAGAAAAPEAAAAEPAKPVSPAEDCLATANAARAAILEGRFADVYGMLPPSWRKDLDGQLVLLSTKVDKPTFTQITGLAGDLASLAEKKGDLIRQWILEERVVEGVSPDDVAKLGAALRALSEWKYEDLKEGRFTALFGDSRIAGLVAFMIAQSMADEGASASEFSLVDPSQTDRVTLHVKLGSRRYRMNEETGEVESSVEYEDENLDWERFEDAWVPVPLSHPEDPEEEGWAYGMRDLREEIEDISPADVGQLTMGLTMFRMVIPMIEQCETTKDLERVFRNMR